MSAKQRLLAALVLPLLAACGSASGPAAPTVAPGSTVTVDLDGRPFQLHVPRAYDPTTRLPLVVLLHGYESSAALHEEYFKLAGESERRGFLYAMPDGTTDRSGKRFWNATAACCDFYGTGVDDSAYLSRLLDTIAASYSVDSRRVYLIGHSNGGFMAYRMACEHAKQITAIASLAGMATDDPGQCRPERPVSILHIHGTADQTIKYGGGTNVGDPYPSVDTTVSGWRRRDGCDDRPETSAAPLDLDSDRPGPETAVTVYAAGCRDGTRVAVWSIEDGGHMPRLTASFTPAVLDFLLAQVSPA
ncbi:polyhydroxybutyrate depolymerase [Allocatelliglobosispora scoriae]|uniref:Polyhydroxybutyrate depolymerase n=1 Tax=Allocatelliglobosispora scoriae TaxID=643052 RepID=A0A841BNE0_9ACTN|nr:PHB depolymerase family esterase [Allocatelliglobosispora scoriae]MBB5868473.1 polyhydroxybutyrate depolymerase [Allocatelliglobosispora scoriae]